MPVYQYHCRSCGHDFQLTEPISKDTFLLFSLSSFFLSFL